MRCLIPFVFALPSVTQAACLDDAMLVFDGSLSMASADLDADILPKIIDARAAVTLVAPEVARYRQVGLVTYGPGGLADCDGVNLRFAPRPNASGALIQGVNGLTPGGSTPLTAATQMAADALGAQGGTIVLVTDGAETCGGNPCGLARDLAAAGKTKVHVIGFRVRGAFFEPQSRDAGDFFPTDSPARCLADETGGEYVAAETLDQLIAALRETLGCLVIG